MAGVAALSLWVSDGVAEQCPDGMTLTEPARRAKAVALLRAITAPKICPGARLASDVHGRPSTLCSVEHSVWLARESRDPAFIEPRFGLAVQT